MEDQIIGEGRCRLHQKLGAGGCGEVWLAEDLKLNDWVAVKFLPATLRGDAAGLLEMGREVAKARRLSHPNVVRMDNLHYSEDEDFPFLTMEYVAGNTLGAFRKTRPDGVMTWEELRPITVQLCDALDCAHTQKLIHRDLKPDNILLTEDGVVKLMDFGISEVVTMSMSRMTGKIGLSGTPYFMGPQQVEGRTPNPSDDIYSFGSTLYYLLTGRPVFSAGKGAGVASVLMRRVRKEDACLLSARLAELSVRNPVPNHVEALIMKCLSREREDRPASMREIRDALAEPVNETKETSISKPRKRRIKKAATENTASPVEFDVEGLQRRIKASIWIVTTVLIGALALMVGMPVLKKHSIAPPKISIEEKGWTPRKSLYLSFNAVWDLETGKNNRKSPSRTDDLSFGRSLWDVLQNRLAHLDAINGAAFAMITNADAHRLQWPQLQSLTYDRSTIEFEQIERYFSIAVRTHESNYSVVVVDERENQRLPKTHITSRYYILRYHVLTNSAVPLEK
jgi:serine/threonine protein kinase